MFVGMIIDQNGDCRRVDLINKGRKALLQGGYVYGGHSRKDRFQISDFMIGPRSVSSFQVFSNKTKTRNGEAKHGPVI